MMNYWSHGESIQIAQRPRPRAISMPVDPVLVRLYKDYIDVD